MRIISYGLHDRTLFHMDCMTAHYFIWIA